MVYAHLTGEILPGNGTTIQLVVTAYVMVA